MKPIRDTRMRSVVMARYLTSAPAATSVHTLVALLRHARTGGDVGYALAIESLVAVLGDGVLLPYKTRASLYAAAKALDRMEIARLFFDVSPDPRSTPGAAGGALDGALGAEWRPTPGSRALTLGERKSLARSHRREVIAVALRDPHPDVVRILLGNPTLTEPDVLQMASRRPAESGSLAVLAGHARWGARHAVRRALVRNPYTPAHWAVRLLTTMRLSDLRIVAHDMQLSELVREQALALLR